MKSHDNPNGHQHETIIFPYVSHMFPAKSAEFHGISTWPRQERVTLMTGAKTTVTFGPAVKDLKKARRDAEVVLGPGTDSHPFYIGIFYFKASNYFGEPHLWKPRYGSPI